jgi:hypothetical protein
MIRKLGHDPMPVNQSRRLLPWGAFAENPALA